MVFVGVGILVVSLSVILYKYGVSPAWAKKETPEEIDRLISPAGLENVEEERHRKERPSIPSFKLDGGDNKGYTPAKSKDAPGAMRPATSTQSKLAPQLRGLEPSNNTLTPPPLISNRNDKQKLVQSHSTLMPPPSRPNLTTSTFKTPPKPSKTLRPPPSAASTLRGPPIRSLAPSTTTTSPRAPTTSTLSPSTRPSSKVLLDPGHSPLDWAHLVANPPTPTFLRGKDVPPQLIRVSPSLLRYHSGRNGKDAWGVWQGKVYNLTPYMKFHPGGVDQLMRGAGKEREGERLFNEMHPWVSWENMLGECLVGILAGEEDG